LGGGHNQRDEGEKRVHVPRAVNLLLRKRENREQRLREQRNSDTREEDN